jgi:outer membrane lipoprotein-sorting protein
MCNFALKPSLKVFAGAMLLLVCVTSSCQQQPATNINTGSNTNTSIISGTNTSNGNTGTSTTGATVTAREPDQYSATVTLKTEMTGSKSVSIPALSANFARNGADRRISFKVPGGDEVIYLDRGNKRYIILPNRKQYAELDAKSTGFDVPTVMTPAQIVNQVKGLSGCENAGDEQFGGRSAVKYRCSGGVKTGTKAGDATAESFIYVDKETNLPLHTESIISSSGNVGGMSAVKIVTEMSNIQTSVPSTVFDEPQGMSKVDPAQVRAQVEAVLNAALYFARNMMQNSSSAPPATPSTTASPTH